MPPTKLPRRWNHLKTIRSMLANLRGGGSLANELIQNADDAEGARRLVFRFTSDYLEVSDNGGFRSCMQPNDPEDCPWEADGRRPCDFHAFRELGAASKASDPNLTGAFGIGFLAVYQITDRPELFSRGIHWILDEANESVDVCDGHCGKSHTTAGTTFLLPWAKEMTYLREKLGAETVSAEDWQRLLRQFRQQVPASMIFLHNLREIQILRETETVACFSRWPDGGKVRISGPDGDEEWLLLEGDFSAEADSLRKKHTPIGARHADVRIALRPGKKINGHLYATLPTTIPTGLPMHLDASFFPRVDRKGILLESSYDGDWNRAAIAAGARLLAAHVEQIAPVLGPEPFWSLVNQAHALARQRTEEAKALATVWERLREALPAASVMWTQAGEWARVSETVARPPNTVLADLLEDLGVPVVSPLIHKLVPSRPLGIVQIGMERLLEGLESLELEEDATLEELPEPLRPRPRRNALRRALGLLAQEELEDSVLKRLQGLALWEGTDGHFSSFSSNWLVSRDTVQPLARFSEYAFVVWPERDDASRALAGVGNRYTIGQALSDLETATEELTQLPVQEARGILAWFQDRLADLSDGEIEQLAALPLMPTEHGLRTATETVRAGGFHDPLELTSVLDRRAAAGLDALIKRFGIRQLSFAAYLREHVAGLDQLGTIQVSALVDLIRQCVAHRDTIDADPELIELLTGLAWIPCGDGIRRQPGEVYFSSALVREVLGTSAPIVHASIRLGTAASDLLRKLGVSDVPRPMDVVANIKKIVAEPPGSEPIMQVVANLRYLAKRADELDPAFAPLRTLAWLPAEGEKKWYAPNQLYLTRSRALFATTGHFIARTADQESLRAILSVLGVRSTPSVGLVVDHVINLAAENRAASLETLRWLNAHAADPLIKQLADRPILPVADGRLERAGRVFRQRHQLVPWRAILRPGLDRLADLLDALDVGHAPDACTAAEVLLEISDAVTGHGKLESQTVAVVNKCWDLLIAATKEDLALLDGHAVVPAADGRLHRARAVLLKDLPGAERWLAEPACERLVALDGRQFAFEDAGVRRLSRTRGGDVLGSTHPIEGHWIEGRLKERWAQLARIVDAEGGDWRPVMGLTQDAKVKAVGALTVRYRLDLAGLPENPAVEEGAFYARDNSCIFVRMIDGRPDWQAFARVVRDEILPGFGPGTSLAIKTALAAKSAEDADADLAEYPALRDGIPAEFEQLSQERARREDLTDDPDIYEDADTGELDQQDADPGDQSSAGDSGNENDEPESGDQQTDGGDHLLRGGPGSGSARDAGGTAGNGSKAGGRVGGGHPNGQPTGSAATPGRKRSPAAKKNGAGADYQLISYVSPNGHSENRGVDGSREWELRDAVGEAGVDLVVEHLRAELQGSGAQIEKMPTNNKGYDILVRDAAGRPQCYIEVKSTEGAWGLRGVGLTKPQFILGLGEGERYWLYVVENLCDAAPRIWWIHDPAGQVTYFHYDRGWKGAAEGPVTMPGAHAAGARSPVKKRV
jgi:hypothetical protein